MIAVLGLTPEEGQALLLAEGDRLAARLVQHFPVRGGDLERAYVVGRSISTNLVQGFFPAATVATTVIVSASTTDTSPDGPFAV